MQSSQLPVQSSPDSEARLRQLEWLVREHSPHGEWTDWTLELARLYAALARSSDVAKLLGACVALPVAEAFALYGSALLETGDAARAAAALEHAAQRFPEDASLKTVWGDALFQGERFAEALQCYRAACALDERNPLPLRRLAQALFRLDRRDEAAKLLRDACMRDPMHAELWSSLGWVLLHRGQHSEAVPALRRALDLKPGDVQCLKSLALACFALGRREESLHCYESVLRLRPEDAECHFGTALLYLAGGHLKVAYQRVEVLQKLSPTLAEELRQKISEAQDR